ncbi:transposase family protein [Streptomyces sp. NPDC058239]|uniref:transposase family protein n=1 Tax=unclassified Streptomyces TaxID=2593676 RepID=UPI0036499081
MADQGQATAEAVADARSGALPYRLQNRTGLVMPHRRRKGEELPDWKQAHNKSHNQFRTRVEHVFARMKTWKILRDWRLKGDGVHHAMLGIARLCNLNLAGRASGRTVHRPHPHPVKDHCRTSPAPR